MAHPTPHAPSTFWKRLIYWLRKMGRHEFAILLTGCLIAGGTWMFIEIAEEVLEGETVVFDERIILIMRNPNDLSDPVGPQYLEELGRDFTALGGAGVLGLLTLAVAGYLLLERKFRLAGLLVIAIGGGVLLSSLLKHSFDRPRPDLVPHGSHVYTTSFPSGHSMMAAITYLTLAALLSRSQKRGEVKIFFLSLAALLTIAVGISRIYMGVHWPTDVLAGWTAGAVWALLCWQLTSWLQHKGQVEQEGTDPAVEADEKTNAQKE